MNEPGPIQSGIAKTEILFTSRALGTLVEQPLLWLSLDDPEGVTTFNDSSGNNRSAFCSSCPTAGVEGRFGGSAAFANSQSQAMFIPNMPLPATNYSNDARSGWILWNGEIDTKPPRVGMNFSYGYGFTDVDVWAEDLNLSTTGLQSPCGSYQSQYNTPNTPPDGSQRLNRITASCRLNGTITQGLTIKACDAFGRCASYSPTRSDTMYLGTNKELQRRALPNGTPSQLFTANAAGAIGLDSARNKIYWADGTSVRHTNVDGTNPQVLVSGLTFANHVVVAPDIGKILYTANGNIYRANFDGSGAEAYRISANPRSLALDAERGRLYYAESFSTLYDVIYAIQIDFEGNRTPIAFSKISTYQEFGQTFQEKGVILRLTVNPINGFVYWNQSYRDPTTLKVKALIRSVDPSQVFGNNTAAVNGVGQSEILMYPKTNVAAGTAGTLGIDPVANKIYWSNNRELWRADLTTNLVRTANPCAPNCLYANYTSEWTNREEVITRFTDASVTFGGIAIDSAFGTVVTAPALELTQTAIPNAGVAGNQQTFAVTIKNIGISNASGVVATNTIPTGVTFIDAKTNRDETCPAPVNRVITCSLQDIGVGTTVTLNVRVTINNGTTGQLTNQASVTMFDVDGNPDNNTASVSVNVSAPTATLTPTSTRTFTPTPTFTPTSAGWTYCANEAQQCTFTGTKTVRYGTNGNAFLYLITAVSPVTCNNAMFGGDPAPGQVKHCDYHDEFTPTPSSTPANTATFTPTFTPSNTPTDTPTFTPTDTPTNTPTDTSTFTPTNMPTNTATRSPGTSTPDGTFYSKQLFWSRPSYSQIISAPIADISNASVAFDVSYPSPQSVRGFVIDGVNHYVYWTRDTSIMRSDMDGSNVVQILDSLVLPRALALDVTTNTLFWRNSSITGTIQMYALDTSTLTTFPEPTGPHNASNGLAVDTEHGRVYWSSFFGITWADFPIWQRKRRSFPPRRSLPECTLTFRMRQLPDAIQLVRACPQIHFVLDHCGKPDIKNHLLKPWREHVSELAQLPNVCCKISGLVTEADVEHWQPEDLLPFMRHVVDAFGADRVLFGSDAPVQYLASTYERWVETLREATQDLKPDAQAKLWHANAEAFYRL